MDSDGTNTKDIRIASPGSTRLLWSPDGRRVLVVGYQSSLVSVGVSPEEPPEVSYPTLGLYFEWMGTNNVSWQPVLR